MRRVIPIMQAGISSVTNAASAASPPHAARLETTAKSATEHDRFAKLSQKTENLLLQSLPPLALYVHVPWCIRKCPYCDFNSHEKHDEIPEDAYLEALAADLEQTLPLIWGRLVHTVFIGGGTPSLLSAGAVDRMLAMIRSYLTLVPDAEITLEANPGAIEAARFESYRASGINRVSLGIQSFNDQHLRALGRVHDSEQAKRAIVLAQKNFERVNLDLMFALPGQTLEQAVADAHLAVSFGTEHLSMYQLAIEPNTVFAKYPPALPDDELSANIENAVCVELSDAGFERYEVSAFAKSGKRARHNVNYWEFGDYIGIGPGAHGKLSFPDKIERYAKIRQPDHWLRAAVRRDASHIAELRGLQSGDMAFEFMLNALRLKTGVPSTLYTERTGQSLAVVTPALQKAMDRGLLSTDPLRIKATEQGWRFLNDLQAIFL